jgi:hypothetical protein
MAAVINLSHRSDCLILHEDLVFRIMALLPTLLETVDLLRNAPLRHLIESDKAGN